LQADTQSKKSSFKSLGGDVVQTVAHILGISDPAQLDPNANLGDLGLDSLMGVEIKQALERDFELVLSMKDIRGVDKMYDPVKDGVNVLYVFQLTLNKLREVVLSGNTASLHSKKESDADGAQADLAEKAEAARSMFAMFRCDECKLAFQQNTQFIYPPHQTPNGRQFPAAGAEHCSAEPSTKRRRDHVAHFLRTFDRGRGRHAGGAGVQADLSCLCFPVHA